MLYREVEQKIKDHNTQLEEIIDKPMLKNGKIQIPSNFGILPFSIERISKRNYRHTATPYNQFDWSTATEIFISDETNTGNGLSYSTPVYLALFITNYKNGAYGGQKNFILTMQNNVYTRSDFFDLNTIDANIYLRSKSINNFTWFARIKRPSKTSEMSNWSLDGSIYKTTQVSNHTILDVVNFVDLDSFGTLKVYEKVNSLELCRNMVGTFYQNGVEVYCNPYVTDKINNCNLLLSSSAFKTAGYVGNMLILENVGFTANTYTFNFSSLSTKFYLFGCKFHRSIQDSFAITGMYNAFLFNCIANYGSKDGFNYHTTDSNSMVVEINCISHSNGKYKLEGGNTTRHSNNGSTAHDGMKVLRVGSKYWDCEGPIVADADNCYSISIGCEVGNILNTTTGVKSAFYMYDDTTTPKRKYILECFANGKDIENAINGTSETYYMDLEGMSGFVGGIKKIDWEEVS